MDAKQMAWLCGSGGDGEKTLHLRLSARKKWQDYRLPDFEEYAVPDFPLDSHSKGWATYLHLRKQGWQLLSSNAIALSEVS
ncbi:MAG: hypothetical protein WBB28_20730 [Crinalium sp.]